MLPSVAGFSFRPAEAADVPAMRAVHDASRERDRIDPDAVCSRTPNLDEATYRRKIESFEAVVVAERDGRVVAHAWLEAWGFEERLYLVQAWVQPDAREQGLGTALLHWGESLARTTHGDDSRIGLHLANATEREADAVALLAHEGYALSFVSVELAFDVSQSLPHSDPVEGVEIRALDAADARRVARALSEANLNPPGHENRFAGDALNERLDLEEAEWADRVAAADSALSRIAWADEEIAAVYLCDRSGRVGEVAQVAVLAPWRGRGVARLLAMASLRGLQEAGCATARLFTSIGPDEEEPTEGPYAMYRKFGFHSIARHLRFRKPMNAG